MLDWQDYIRRDPNILYGKPTVSGTRIPVDLILEKLAYGESMEQLLQAYPRLTQEAIYACLFFAAEAVKNEVVYKLAS
jgi:uncharacterized protein (DUF433 family)